MREEAGIQPSDHDRLVEIHTLLRDQLAPTVRDHESRIRKLERAIWLAAGFAAAVGSAVGSVLGGATG